jgi:hypothetical protein
MDRFVIGHLFATALAWVRVGRLGESEKEPELLLLRQQVRILERKWDKPTHPSRIEKLTLAVVADMLKTITQQARQIMWQLRERQPAIHFLIHDRDRKFVAVFDMVFRSTWTHVIRTPFRMPCANAYCRALGPHRAARVCEQSLHSQRSPFAARAPQRNVSSTTIAHVRARGSSSTCQSRIRPHHEPVLSAVARRWRHYSRLLSRGAAPAPFWTSFFGHTCSGLADRWGLGTRAIAFLMRTYLAPCTSFPRSFGKMASYNLELSLKRSHR